MTPEEQQLADFRAGRPVAPIAPPPPPTPGDGLAVTPEGQQLAAFRAGKPVAPIAAPQAPKPKGPYEGIIQAAAKRHGVDPDLVRSVIHAESAGNPRARSPVGAQGLMQLMPGTAAGLGVKNAYDPIENVEGGTKYLRQLSDMFGGDMALVAQAYNAGPGAVKKHKGNVPYAETQAYKQKVLAGLADSAEGQQLAAFRAGKSIAPYKPPFYPTPDGLPTRRMHAQANAAEAARPVTPDELYGPNAYNPFQRGATRPRNPLELVQAAVRPFAYGEVPDDSMVYRQMAAQGRVRPVQLPPPGPARQAAVEEINSIYPLIEKFMGDGPGAPEKVRAAIVRARDALGSDVKDDAWYAALAAKNSHHFAEFAKLNGATLTPLQRQAAASILMAERAKLVNANPQAQELLKNGAITAATWELGGLVAEPLKPYLGRLTSKLPAVVQAAGKTPVGGYIARHLNPADLFGSGVGFGAFRGASDAFNPNIKAEDRLPRIGEAVAQGIMLHGPFSAGMEGAGMLLGAGKHAVRDNLGRFTPAPTPEPPAFWKRRVPGDVSAPPSGRLAGQAPAGLTRPGGPSADVMRMATALQAGDAAAVSRLLDELGPERAMAAADQVQRMHAGPKQVPLAEPSGAGSRFQPQAATKGLTPERMAALGKQSQRVEHEIRMNRAEDPQPNTDYEWNKPGQDVALHYDAHGMAAQGEVNGRVASPIERLDHILRDGIDPKRPFYTGSLKGDPTGETGVRSYGSPFILVSEPGKLLRDGPVRTVIVNEAMYHAIPELQAAHPEVQFIRGDQAADALTAKLKGSARAKAPASITMGGAAHSTSAPAATLSALDAEIAGGGPPPVQPPKPTASAAPEPTPAPPAGRRVITGAETVEPPPMTRAQRMAAPAIEKLTQVREMLSGLPQNLSEAQQAFHGAVGDFAGKSLPRITRSNKAAGEAGVRYVSSRQAGTEAARSMGHLLVGGADKHQLGAVLTEDNLRSVFARAQMEADAARANLQAAQITKKGGKAALQEAARQAGADAAAAANDAAKWAGEAKRHQAAAAKARLGLANSAEKARAGEAARSAAEQRSAVLKSGRKATGIQAQETAKQAALEATAVAKAARQRATAVAKEAAEAARSTAAVAQTARQRATLAAKEAANAAREAAGAASRLERARQRAQSAARSGNATGYYEAEVEKILEQAKKKDAIAAVKATARDRHLKTAADAEAAAVRQRAQSKLAREQHLQTAREAQEAAVRLRAHAKSTIREAATGAAATATEAERLKGVAKAESANARKARGTTEPADVDAANAHAQAAAEARRQQIIATRAETRRATLEAAANATAHVNDHQILIARRRQFVQAEKALREAATLVGNGGYFKDEEAFQAALHEPKIQAALARWKEHFEPEMNRLYDEARGLDPTSTTHNPRGEHTGVRINLKGVQDDAATLEPAMAATLGGNLNNAKLKRTKFAQKATGAAANYDINAHNIIANTYGGTLENANYRKFLNALVDAGDAVIGKPGQQATLTLKGEPVAPIDIKGANFTTQPRTVKGPDGEKVALTQGGSHNVSQTLYVRKSLAGEFRQALAVDQPFDQVPGFKQANALALKGIAEPAMHAGNLLGILQSRPMGRSVTEQLISSAGGLPNLTTVLNGLWKEHVGRNSVESLARYAELSKIGAGRAEHLNSGAAGHFLHDLDRAARLYADKSYELLRDKGLVEDSETARREWINQLGQYNRRAQPRLMAALRETGVAPFLSAGRTMTAGAIRTKLVQPGVKATSAPAAALLRGQMISRYLLGMAQVGTVSYLLTKDKGGGFGGRPGTREFSVDTGFDTNDGKHIEIPLGDALGNYGRADRVTGIGPYLQARKNGQPVAAAVGEGMKSAANNVIGSLYGPGPRFIHGVLTGEDPFIGGRRIAPIVPPGQNQFLGNAKAAALETNGLFRAAEEGHKPAPMRSSDPNAISPGLERAMNIVHSLLPRGTPQPTTTTAKAQSLPRRIQGAQVHAYAEDLIQRARRLPQGERIRFINKELDGAAPGDRARLKQMLYERNFTRLMAP